MSSSKRSLVLVVVVVVVVSVAEALSAVFEWPSSRQHVDGVRTLTNSYRRRSRRRTTVDDLRTMFGGIRDMDRLTRLTELANQDMAAALLEYNEMVLTMATGNGSQARTCWMRLNYNVTTSPGGLTDLFRDQV